MKEKFTPGPWRWELNEQAKQINLCGGIPTFDKTVMGFNRYGFQNAIPTFNDEPNGGYCIMHKATKYAEVVEGREHHAHWFKAINHPDARLICAAPEMYGLLKNLIELPASDMDALRPDIQSLLNSVYNG